MGASIDEEAAKETTVDPQLELSFQEDLRSFKEAGIDGQLFPSVEAIGAVALENQLFSKYELPDVNFFQISREICPSLSLDDAIRRLKFDEYSSIVVTPDASGADGRKLLVPLMEFGFFSFDESFLPDDFKATFSDVIAINGGSCNTKHSLPTNDCVLAIRDSGKVLSKYFKGWTLDADYSRFSSECDRSETASSLTSLESIELEGFPGAFFFLQISDSDSDIRFVRTISFFPVGNLGMMFYQELTLVVNAIKRFKDTDPSTDRVFDSAMEFFPDLQREFLDLVRTNSSTPALLELLLKKAVLDMAEQ